MNIIDSILLYVALLETSTGSHQVIAVLMGFWEFVKSSPEPMLEDLFVNARLRSCCHEVRGSIRPHDVVVPMFLQQTAKHTSSASYIKDGRISGDVKAAFFFGLINLLGHHLLLVAEFNNFAHVLVHFWVHLVVHFNDFCSLMLGLC